MNNLYEFWLEEICQWKSQGVLNEAESADLSDILNVEIIKDCLIHMKDISVASEKKENILNAISHLQDDLKEYMTEKRSDYDLFFMKKCAEREIMRKNDPNCHVYKKQTADRITDIYKHMNKYFIFKGIIELCFDELCDINENMLAAERRYQITDDEMEGGFYCENPISELTVDNVKRRALQKNIKREDYYAEYLYAQDKRLIQRITYASDKAVQNKMIYLWSGSQVIMVKKGMLHQIEKINWRNYENGILNNYETVLFPIVPVTKPNPLLRLFSARESRFKFKSFCVQYENDVINRIAEESLDSIEKKGKSLLPYIYYYNKSGKEFETSEAGNLTAFTTYFSITGGWYIDRDDRELVKESLGKDMGINGTRWKEPVLFG